MIKITIYIIIAIACLFLCLYKSNFWKDLVFLFKSNNPNVEDKSFSSLNTKLQNANKKIINLLYTKSYEDILQTLSLRDAENKNIFSYTIILTALLSALFFFGKILFNPNYKEIFFALVFCLSISVLCLIVSTIAYFKALSFQYEIPRDIASIIDYDLRTIKINSIATNASGAYKNLLANRDKVKTCKIAKKYMKICLIFYLLFSLAVFLQKLAPFFK